MQKKIQREKTKGNKKLDPATQRLRRDYSTLESKLDLADKMIKLAIDKKYTLMTQVALDLGYCFEDLQMLADDHPEIKEAHEKTKRILGRNAYEGIENRTLSGTFSKYSVTKYNKEVREQREAMKLEEHQREIEKIMARKEAQKEQYQEIITEIREKNGKKVAVVSVDENILLPDEE